MILMNWKRKMNNPFLNSKVRLIQSKIRTLHYVCGLLIQSAPTSILRTHFLRIQSVLKRFPVLSCNVCLDCIEFNVDNLYKLVSKYAFSVDEHTLRTICVDKFYPTSECLWQISKFKLSDELNPYRASDNDAEIERNYLCKLTGIDYDDIIQFAKENNLLPYQGFELLELQGHINFIEIILA